MPENLPFPLGGSAPLEVPLPKSPLVRVVAQVRLPGIIKIGLPEEASRFQEAIRTEYPLFEQNSMNEVRIDLAAGAPSIQQSPGSVWRFSDLDSNWRVSLMSTSVSIETTAYTSRVEFLERWSAILARVDDQFSPKIAQRTGLRYIDRVTDDGFNGFDAMIRPEMLGLTAAATRPFVAHSLSEVLMTTEEGKALMRWGILPPNVVIDPAMMSPHPLMSWVLDIDSFSDAQLPFAPTQLAELFERLAHRAYAIFRYIVNDDFLRFYGGVL